MTLEYRCSKCGTLLQTTNADPLYDEIERLRHLTYDYEQEIERLQQALRLSDACRAHAEEECERLRCKLWRQKNE